MAVPLSEVFVFALLLLGVWGAYVLLKLHYIFAFGLVQKTDISLEKKQKIEKIKKYIFAFLKVLLLVGLVAVSIFGFETLSTGGSLQEVVIETWGKIPEGFWFSLLWTLLRIALLIVLMKYLLKIIYRFLDKEQEKILLKKRYNSDNVKMVYLRVHNAIKFTVVLGVVYRIIHFFPFLEEVSDVFLFALLSFVSIASLITLRETILMYQTRK